MSSIVLTTLNARFIHSAFGLRYLKANLAELEDACDIVEFTIHERPIDIAEQLLKRKARIIGFGVYVWNVEEIENTIAIIKQVSPQTIVVIGGPEVSYEQDQQNVCRLADYVIAGAADLAFRNLCYRLLADQYPSEKIIQAQDINPDELKLPYYLYDDRDIAHRIIYVEASRGCPFKCEFCLSALDKTAWPFDPDLFLEQVELLYRRGVRHFKFVDRTFNLKIDNTVRILEFFLERMDENLFLHFELIPDHLPERLKEVIACFPKNSLQFEIGIQSFNPQTQALISRKQDNEKTVENLRWLRNKSNAHIHADLIVGLPGEDCGSFATGLNRLVELDPHEIQVGMLKRLRGSPISRHTEQYAMRFNPQPPYNILSNNFIDFDTMQRLNRFARYWDMIINSGRFNYSKPVILANDSFRRFMTLSDWLFRITGQTHQIALKRLFELLYQGMVEALQVEANEAQRMLLQDFHLSGLKGYPSFECGQKVISYPSNKGVSRQKRHL
jgi:radical SAM superfamily enzyme YgiQ (UPF0313 family)